MANLTHALVARGTGDIMRVKQSYKEFYEQVLKEKRQQESLLISEREMRKVVEKELTTFRITVTAALEELRGLITLEYIGDEFSDYNEGLRDALLHVDATVFSLGFSASEGCRNSMRVS